MNTRLVIGVSIALNAAMAAGAFVLIRKPAARMEPVNAAAPTVTQSSAVSTAAPVPSASSGPAAAAFDWSRIASSDLKVYRDNLLRIRCPKATVHDILLGEINEQFELRRQNALAAVQNRFWDFAVRGEQALRTEWGQPIEILAAERQKILEDLFGKDYGIAEADSEANHDAAQRHFLWLPEEKRDRLAALEQKYQQQLEEWSQTVGQHTGAELSVQENSRLRQLQTEYEDAKKALLTPEELEEARLRGSKESLWAVGLEGFEPTEAEWRAVTKLHADFEDSQRNVAGLALTDEERRQRLDKLQDELMQATREVLGPSRYREFETAGDQSFQDLHKVTQRYALPDHVATQAYELQQSALAEANRLREEATLSPEARQTALTTLQQQTEGSLSRTLGDKVLSTYREYGGGWLQELNRIEPN